MALTGIVGCGERIKNARASSAAGPSSERGGRTISHEEFAERVAERLEARADTLDNEEWPAGCAATTVCVRELRVAAENGAGGSRHGDRGRSAAARGAGVRSYYGPGGGGDLRV